MKKYIAFVLSSIMTFSACTFTYAQETDTNIIKEDVVSSAAVTPERTPVPYSDGLYIVKDDSQFSHAAMTVNGYHIENEKGDVLSESYLHITPLSGRQALFIFSIPAGMTDTGNGVLKIENGKEVTLFGASPCTYRAMDIGETAVWFSPGEGTCPYYDMNGAEIPDLGVYLKKYNISLERSKWAEDAIKKAWDWGYMPEELGYNYKNNITRREYCHLAVNFLDNIYGDRNLKQLGNTGDKPFTDTDDPYVAAAAKLGIVSGMGDGTFMPDKNITRQEAAVLLWKMAEYMGIYEGKKSFSFADDASMGSWAREYIYNVCSAKDGDGNGIMAGTGNNMFSPTAYYTREQAITTMARMLDVQEIQKSWENL